MLYQWSSDRQTTYVHLGGSLIATGTRNPTVPFSSFRFTYQHTDALGSPVVVTDQSGVAGERAEFEPYGQVLNHPLRDGPGYTGHVSDATTGLSYMQQRYYDPAIGRFLSVDPIAAYSRRGISFDRYWYANDNPYRFADPDGRYSCAREGATCSEKDAAKMKKYVDSLRAAHAKMKPGAAADRVGSILKAIGTAWDNNGVTLNFANLGGDNLGSQDGRTLNIDDKAITAFAREMGLKSVSNLAGGVIVHEGSHMIDSELFQGNVYPTSGAERMLTEIRAYGTESAIHNVLGIRSGINAPGMSVLDRSSAIMNAARVSYENACASGGWGCDYD